MSNHFSHPISTPLDPPGEANLLPSGGRLPPPTDGGKLLALDTEGGEILANEVAAQLSRAGAEAKELAALAASLAAQRAPEIKAKARIASAKVGEMANKAMDKAEATAAAAGETWADPARRRSALAAHWKKGAIGLGAVALLAGGAWAFASHQATTIARDKVDGFIVRNNLRDKVSYADLSASPLGSATLTGVKISLSPAAAIKIGSLEISDVEMKNDLMERISVSAKSAEIPLLAMARQRFLGSTFDDAIGLGYTTLTGDVAVAARLDEDKGMLHFETSGEMRDAGSWKFKIDLGGISAKMIGSLTALSQSAQNENAYALAADEGLRGLGHLTLSRAELTLDNTGLRKRFGEVTDLDLPPDGNAQDAPQGPIDNDETRLVQAGMSPAEAHAARTAVTNWMKNGGSITVATNLDTPLPLFQHGNLFAPAFDGVGGFLVATRSKITN